MNSETEIKGNSNTRLIKIIVHIAFVVILSVLIS